MLKMMTYGIFFLSVNIDEYSLVVQEPLLKNIETKNHENKVWKMFFNGALSKDSLGTGVVFVSTTKESHTFSFKFEFEMTNNVVEYEAFLLGLETTRKLKL